MDVDPRLQLSDLTDYHFQASLAQQYGSYNTTGMQQTGNPRFAQPTGYFQTVPQDETRTSNLRSSQQYNLPPSPQRAQRLSIDQSQGANLYQQTAGPNLLQGYSSRSSPAINASTNSAKQGPIVSKNSIAVNRSNSTRSILAIARSDGGSPRQNSPASTSSPANRPLQQGNTDVKDPTIFTPPHLLAPMKPNPPSLREWRNKFFNIDEPLLLTEEQYLTYFPHVDNVYSHRSTQKYKRKPFVSHYWDCRLKGRPTGTPMNKKKGQGDGDEQEKKKRKRKVRERDLCDVKIKVTEFFGVEELDALRKLGLGPEVNSGGHQAEDIGDLTFVVNGQQQNESNDSTFGVLEPNQNYPPGHPGSGGKKWYMVQRVNGNDKDGDDPEDRDLDHKHTLEESDRIKKNSVQRWLLAREKEKKKAARDDSINTREDRSDDEMTQTASSVPTPPARFHASGFALQTVNAHTTPTSNNLTFYGCSFCPFAQRVWIALEAIGIPYRYVEINERDWILSPSGGPRKLNIPELRECNPEDRVPCIKHNNFCVWESLVMLEYLEDLAMGQSLFQPAVGNAQLKAHSRLWADFINRRILPVFYALLLLPEKDNTGASSGSESAADHVVNPAERNGHAEPKRTPYNDETYPLAKTSLSYYPGSKQRDPSTLPLTTQASTQFSSRISTTGTLQTSPKAQKLISTLLTNITTLVNASHRTGPYFLGPNLSFVDIAFAPWIIRLNYVLSHYRNFPRPEVGTRWREWCDAIQSNEVVQRTVSEEDHYREVYGGGFESVTGVNSVSKGGDYNPAATGEGGWHYDEFGRVNVNKAMQERNSFPEMPWADRALYGGIDALDKGFTEGGIFGYSFD